MNGVPDGNAPIVILDQAGLVLRATPSLRKLLAHPLAVGTPVEQLGSLVHPDDAPEARRVAAAVISRPGASAEVRARVRRSEGDWLRLRVAVENRLDDPGVTGIIVRVLDAMAARAGGGPRVELPRWLFDAVPWNIGVLGDDGRFVAANPALCRLLGYDESEMCRRWPGTLAHPGDSAASSPLDELGLGGVLQVVRTPRRYLRSDGSVVPVHEIRSPLQSPEGDELVLVQLVVREGGRERERQQADEQDLATAIDAGGFLVTVTDSEGRIVRFYDGAERATGRSRTETVGLSVLDVFPAPRGAGGLADLLAAVQRGEAPGEVETAWLAPGETVRTVAWTATPLDPAGQEIVFIGVDVTERHHVLAELTHRSMHDSLTGLPNRTLLMEQLHHAVSRLGRAPGEVAVLFIDLNNFKEVNDSFGHETGDELLKAVAERFRSATRQSDTVARLGGDEFVVLCEDIEDEPVVFDIANRLIEALELPYQLSAAEVRIGTSIGVAFARGSDVDPETLLRQADEAMYRAKALDSGLFSVEGTQNGSTRSTASLTHADVQQAIEDRGLAVVYQPRVDLDEGNLVGVEALARLRVPRLGMVLPAAFLELARETGLIVAMGASVFEEACRQAVRWNDASPRPIVVAVNLSASELFHADIVPTIEAILDRTGVDPAVVSLEVAERVLHEDASRAGAVMSELKHLGIAITLDVVEGDARSRRYLRALDVDEVKLATSLVRALRPDEDPASVVRLTKLAHSYDMRVAATGVEDDTQLAAARRVGCDVVQGHRLSAPQPGNVISRLVRADMLWPLGPSSHGRED